MADTAEARPAEPVGDAVRPLAALALVAVLCQDAGTGAVIDIVDGLASGQLLVDAATLLVVVVDVPILLYHRVIVVEEFRVISVV